MYRQMVDYINDNFDDVNASFLVGKRAWLSLHIKKYDIIFSVVPFLFKPLSAKSFIFNPR
jgi:hypothetical protein